MPEAYTSPAEGADADSFVRDPGGPARRGRFVRALEFHAGNARVVHHANIKIDATGSSRRLDAGRRRPGIRGKQPRREISGWLFSGLARPASARTRRRETPGISPPAVDPRRRTAPDADRQK